MSDGERRCSFFVFGAGDDDDSGIVIIDVPDSSLVTSQRVLNSDHQIRITGCDGVIRTSALGTMYKCFSPFSLL